MATGQGYQQFHNEPVPAYPAQPTGTYSTPYYGATVVPVQPQPTVIIAPGPSQSFTAQILLACFTFWCCGCVMGLIAFVLALMAQDKAQVDAVGARSLGRASLIVSVVGITIGIALIVALSVNYCRYNINGMCFRYRSYSPNSYDCDHTHPGITFWYGSYCYYNY